MLVKFSHDVHLADAAGNQRLVPAGEAFEMPDEEASERIILDPNLSAASPAKASARQAPSQPAVDAAPEE